MADKQTGTGASGKGHKSSNSRGDDQTKNPVSAKNNSKQQKGANRSDQTNERGRDSKGGS